MRTSNLCTRFCRILTAAVLLAVFAAPSHAQNEEIVTGVEMSEDAVKRLDEMEELDAESIIGMLDNGLFALECAMPVRMRAIVMFVTEDDVTHIESEPAELEPGRHPVAVMWGGNYSRLEERLADFRYKPGSADAFFPETVFSSEEGIMESMRDEMEIGDGRVGLIMFLTVADREGAEKMGDALQIRPMGLAFNAGN